MTTQTEPVTASERRSIERAALIDALECASQAAQTAENSARTRITHADSPRSLVYASAYIAATAKIRMSAFSALVNAINTQPGG